MVNTKYYLAIVYGSVDPTVIGEYLNDEVRGETAREIHGGNDETIDYDPDEDGIFMLDVVDGVPEMYAYSGGFFCENEEDENCEW